MDSFPSHPTHLCRRCIAAIAGACAAAAIARWVTALRRVEVVGPSMMPTLQPGDRLLLAGVRQPRAGDIVALVDPREPSRILVKRVLSVSDQMVEVGGDNPTESTGSETFGAVPARSLHGRAIYRYAPPTRVGRVSGRQKTP